MAAYNQVAGRSLERIAALSDGIFAVAMTLLVLDLHGPARELVHSEGDLTRAVCAIAPQMVMYFASFLTLGIFWHGQQAQMTLMKESDRHLSWIHLTFLCAVCLMPFSTRMLAEFITYKTALLIYWLNIVVLGVVLYVAWRYAGHAGLYKEEVTHDLRCAMERRIVVAQAIYAVGAALCFVSPWVSIAVFVLAQLNYAIAPRIKWLEKI